MMRRQRFTPPEKPKTKDKQTGRASLPPVTDEFIASLRGCCKGDESSVDALHRERQEKSFVERRGEK